MGVRLPPGSPFSSRQCGTNTEISLFNQGRLTSVSCASGPAFEGGIVAGAFGRYLDLEEAIAMGLLPALPRERMVQVGNAAGAGVRRILVCRSARARALRLAREARYLELASRPDFQKAFVNRINF